MRRFNFYELDPIEKLSGEKRYLQIMMNEHNNEFVLLLLHPPIRIVSLSYIITKPRVSFPQTETYYELPHFKEVLKVTNPAENENPALCQLNERKQSSPSPFANYHQAQNCEPETREYYEDCD
ncbi:hypothetical protein CEXT_464151 [Caerostris extrusa]|uniref:Uncharacterized protein n=1 Tax=Caerostris extrusa TaxID=172846 RepID=A0AAV4VNH0_CAEEX|nr:hypothetical protein CEXT_464151 [Caerostris extrusa]